jgi:hypothetical protein
MVSRLSNCKFFEFPVISDPRGNLTFVEGMIHIPFKIERVYYLTKVPEYAERGGHAHKALHQIIIPIVGSFEIKIDDGMTKQNLHLNQNNKGLYICPLIWREINRFSKDAVCLVLASDHFNERDYLRDYGAFINYIQNNHE